VKSESIDYLLARQCSRQWTGFLKALATEFSTQIDLSELRSLMNRIGTRFGVQTSLPPCVSVEEVQLAMNVIWRDMDWGWVEIEESDHALCIMHFCTPISAAFGQDMQDWTPAFLEGVYQQWLLALGASDSLRVRQVAQIDEFGRIDFRLSL
jgi:hypothetical protein